MVLQYSIASLFYVSSFLSAYNDEVDSLVCVLAFVLFSFNKYSILLACLDLFYYSRIISFIYNKCLQYNAKVNSCRRILEYRLLNAECQMLNECNSASKGGLCSSYIESVEL